MIYKTEQDGKTDLMRVHLEPHAEQQRRSSKKREEELTLSSKSSAIMSIVIVRPSELFVSFLSSYCQC